MLQFDGFFKDERRLYGNERAWSAAAGQLLQAETLLAEAFGLTLCCVSMFIGLALRQEEAVQAFGLIWLFPLTFVSSAFVPVESMPGWLQAFAVNQPITHVVNALRSLALGTPMGDNLWLSLAWLVAIAAVFMPLCVRAYKRVS